MNVSYGGKVPKMRTTIVQELGEFPATLTLNQEQSLVFTNEDSGPFYLNPTERERLKHDVQLEGTTSRDLLKVELLTELRKSGYDTTKRRYLL